MSLHDAYARVTPFEIAFPDRDIVERLGRDVDEESSSRGVDPQMPDVFITLGAVGDFLGELLGPDAPLEALPEYGALLFHAVHFARAGQPVYLLETAATRYLIQGSPAGEPRPPARAGYLQLPQHLFWLEGAEAGVPESMDGLFWSVSDSGVLHTLPITGVLPHRAGFRALPLPEAPISDAGQWLESEMREGGADYSSSLPGQDLDVLYSMTTAGEVLKLLARFFAYLDVAPALNEPPTPLGHAHPEAGPLPSRLPYAAVKLVA